MLEVNASLAGIIITVLLAVISLAAWVGALSQRVRRNELDIIEDRNLNRGDHQLMFNKLEEINLYLRNGKSKG